MITILRDDLRLKFISTRLVSDEPGAMLLLVAKYLTQRLAAAVVPEARPLARARVAQLQHAGTLAAIVQHLFFTSITRRGDR